LREVSKKGAKDALRLGDLPDALLVDRVPALAGCPELAAYKTLGELRKNPPKLAPPPVAAVLDRTIQSFQNQRGPTALQYTSFEAIFRHFNDRLFGGELPDVVLSFSTSRRNSGHFAPEVWKARADEGPGILHEIAINPSGLHDEKEVASTIVHEMCHLWEELRGTASRRGYHNKIWAAQMEAIGLMPSSTGAPGGKRTGQSIADYVIAGGPFEGAFSTLPEGAMFPLVHALTPITEAAEGTDPMDDLSKVKYTCPKCGHNAWCKLITDGAIWCGVGDAQPHARMRRADDASETEASQ
jgi:hypothetical protein